VLTTFVDEARPELATTDATDNRTLPSVVWYPAAEATRARPKAALGDALLPAVRSTLGALTAAGYLDTPSNSVVDADIADGGPFPLIVFSHGNTGIGAQSYFLTEYLASHGYIVVCPDHTGNAIMTQMPGGTAIGYGGEGGAYSLAMATADRPADVSFLVDAMTELNADDPAGRFTDKVGLDHIGLTGHSFGGLTTLLGMEQDDRFDVGAPMAPAVPASSAIDRPVIHFVASEDQTLPIPAIATNYASLTGPKAYITVVDAGHFSFSNGCPFGIGAGDGCGEGTRLADGSTFTFIADSRVHEITKYYQTALWGYYLKGIEEYSKDLLAQPFGSDVTIERDGMP
jgi:predicted dienelactone hydrolase